MLNFFWNYKNSVELRGEGDPEQSYSERQLYEMALGRFARELVAVNDIAIEDAIKKTEENLKASS